MIACRLALLTVLIRVKASLSEGVLYSILLMNMMTPLIDSAVNGNQITNAKKNWAKVGIVAAFSLVCVFGVSSVITGKPVENLDDDTPAVSHGAASSEYEFAEGIIEHNGDEFIVGATSGIGGQDILKITMDGSKIASVEFVQFGDTPGIGDNCNKEEYLSRIEGRYYH